MPRLLHSLLLCALLSSCASGGGAAAADAAVVAEHLARQRTLNDAAVAPAGGSRSQEPQEPQKPKIDQVEPDGIGTRPFRPSWTPFEVRFEAGLGRLEVAAPRSTLLDATSAAQLRLDVDAFPDKPLGVGIRLGALSTDNDLFAGSLINDGVVPVRADTRAWSAEAFPNLRWRVEVGDVTVTTRMGALFDYTRFDHREAEVTRTWTTIGSRFETEPSVALWSGGDDSFELFGRAGGQFGYGRFHEDYTVGHSDDSMSRWSYDVGVGLRWRSGSTSFSVGYEFGEFRIDGTRTDLFGDRSSVKGDRSMLFFGGSFRF